MALPFSNKVNEAVELFEKGERRKAIEMAKEILTERQNIPNAYLDLANFYKKKYPQTQIVLGGWFVSFFTLPAVSLH